MLDSALYSPPEQKGLAHVPIPDSFCLTAVISPAIAQEEPTESNPFDFAILRAWLTELRAQKTLLPTFKVTMTRGRIQCDE